MVFLSSPLARLFDYENICMCPWCIHGWRTPPARPKMSHLTTISPTPFLLFSPTPIIYENQSPTYRGFRCSSSILNGGR